jgi:hypothetical protein
MRWISAASLVVLTLSVVAAAQIRGTSMMPGQHVQIGTTPASVGASVPPGIHIGTSQFPPLHNGNFRFHHHHHFPGTFFAYPYYDYGYGYAPYAWDYGYDDYPGYTGYIPGTFDAYPYSGYPYPSQNAGYAYPQQYAPPPPNYYVPRNVPPPAPSAPPDSYQQPQSNSRSRQSGAESAEPTVLVYRDGHRQEIANYAIMGSTLFVLSGPRARIPVAELDVPATERVNQSRGVEFHVPKAQ